MKKCIFFFSIFCVLFVKAYSQTASTTVISYQTGIVGGNCFLFIPPGPTNPTVVSGLNHYAVVGGVYYTGAEFRLLSNNSGGGSAYGIYYPFTSAYSYTIVVTAKATASQMKLQYSTNSSRGAIPSSCNASNVATIITSGADYTSNMTNIASTYTNYTIASNYTPTATGVNYLLIGAYNTVTTAAEIDIQSVTITATPLCEPATITNVVALGAGQAQIYFTPPVGFSVGNYDAVLTGGPPDIFYIGGIPYPIPHTYAFPNVGTSSPVVVTVPANYSYTIYLRSDCANNKKSNSNTIVKTIN